MKLKSTAAGNKAKNGNSSAFPSEQTFFLLFFLPEFSQAFPGFLQQHTGIPACRLRFFGPLQTLPDIFFRTGNQQIVMCQQEHTGGISGFRGLAAQFKSLPQILFDSMISVKI